MKAIRTWTTVGIVLNIVTAVLWALLIILTVWGLGYVGDSVADLWQYVEDIDAESVVAGYALVGGAFGGVGMTLVYVALLVIILVEIFFLVLAVVPAILGIIWNRRHRRDADTQPTVKAGYGNIVARLIINAISCLLMLAFLLEGDGDALLWLGTGYQGVIVATQAVCLARVRNEYQP